jgi:uncharacterized membrane protein YkgB
MNSLVKALARSGLLEGDLDFHLVRGSMVLIFLLFGYQKWFEYEAQTLVPFISNGPLTFWMYPVFGLRGASCFLGVSEWLTAALLICGFRNPRAGIVGDVLSAGTFVTTVSIIPFMPDGWNAAVGFPAMQGNVAFLMKDVVLLAVSVYLVKQDAARAFRSVAEQHESGHVGPVGDWAAGQVAAKWSSGRQPTTRPAGAFGQEGGSDGDLDSCGCP